jgi:peptidoglycan/LPS O-acetylase OafA/YrhL
MRPAADRFPLVDSLRAIAALAVFGTHAAIFAGFAYPGSDVGRFAQRLEVGVAVFFVISGFLLYRPFLVARVRGGRRPDTRAYAWRRFLRIAPAYWVALTVSAVVLGLPGVLTPEGLWTYYGFAQTWRTATIGGGLTQAWTLSVEVAFYAFLPLWALLMRRTGGASRRAVLAREAAGLAALVAVALAWKVAVLSGSPAEQVVISPLLLALPSYLDHFALGMGLALLTVWLEGRDAIPRAVAVLDRFPALPWVVAAGAFWLVSAGIGIGDALFEPMTRGQYLARHLLYAVIGVALLTPAVLGTVDRGGVRRLLGTPLLRWLGLISYGIYLWHFTGLALLERAGLEVQASGPATALVWGGLGLAIAVAAAAASWYLVERPALTLKRLVPARRPAPAEPAHADAPEVLARRAEPVEAGSGRP